MDQCIVHAGFNLQVSYLQGDDISFFDTLDDTLVVVQTDGLKRVDNVGQYTHYANVSSWPYKSTWITNFIRNTTVIYDETKTQVEINIIKNLLLKMFSQNGQAEHSLSRNQNISKQQTIRTNKRLMQMSNQINLPCSGTEGN